MTLSEIQTEFTDSPCVSTLTTGQLLWLAVKLLWNNTQGSSTPMTLSDIQNQFDESPCVGTLAQGQLEALAVMLLFDGGGGGGGGAVAASGDNFCYSGVAPNQILKIKNLDTGDANRLDAVGADGSQTLELDVSTPC